jgi:Cu(I)/Ag(I) efflux system membrane fusion protein
MHAVPRPFQQQVTEALDAYFVLGDALSHDNLDAARKALPTFQSALVAVDSSLLEGQARVDWMQVLERIQAGWNDMEAATDIQSARAGFEHLSDGLITAADLFGLAGDNPVYLYHCPMALDGQGADWLQNERGTENPYYGSQMFSCGSELRVIRPHAEGHHD